jgi:hypothetical protein
MSRRSDQCSMYQRSSSMRSLHGSAALPLTCALHRRPRADKAHLTAHHVQQVGQLVERQPAQQRPDTRDAGIALVDCEARSHALGAAHHRAQLVEIERHPALADPALTVDRRAARLEHDRRDGQSRQRRRDDEQEQRARRVEHPLHCAAGARARIRRNAHVLPSARSQVVGVPLRSQSQRPAASDAVTST